MKFIFIFLAGCAANTPSVYPRGTSLPDSAWYPVAPVPVPAVVVSEPVYLGPRTCEEKFADELARAEGDRERVVAEQAKIDAMCVPTVARTTRRWVDGTELSGPTRMAWNCGGTLVDQKPAPKGDLWALYRVRNKIRSCDICADPHWWDADGIQHVKPMCLP